MKLEGRTTAQAVREGTLYEVSNPVYAKHGRQFPAAETPLESVQCMVSQWWPNWAPWFPDGTVFEVVRVLDATIGCVYVDATTVYRFAYSRGQITEVN